jgi:2-desacetyl-2-hydroxyethyl bacteriochlorophyllide A dehydrogenase
MRAVRCKGSAVEVMEVGPPAGEGVRVRVASAGICGSDLHLIGSPFIGDRTLGHEVAGWLDDGTPVAVEPVAPCETCPACLRGAYNLCVRGPAMVYGTALDGGMAEEMRVPARSIVRLPAGLEPRDACLVEPHAVAIHGLRRARLRGDRRVAVVGGGSIGLCAVAAARAAGAEVALVARHDTQREAGARLGATTAEGSYDLVVEAAGTASAVEAAVALTRPGGTVAMVGSYWEGLSVPGFAISLKEVSLVPASMYGREGALRDIDAAAAILASDPTVAEAIITHRFPLDAAQEAFAAAADRASGAIKVVLEP